MNPALRSSAAHVFVQSIHVPDLEPDDEHHLFRVLRLRDGEAVTISDGRGAWMLTEVAGGTLRPSGEVVRPPAPTSLTIASAIPKGDRAEWMVQKLTEVGVTEILLLHCARSVVRWEGERGERQLARARRVAREAAMQCRRVWLPEVRGPVAFAEVAGLPGAVAADPDGGPLTAATAVLIGPEGGFSPDELAAAQSVVRLSDLVLRVETAALVAAIKILFTESVNSSAQ